MSALRSRRHVIAREHHARLRAENVPISPCLFSRSSGGPHKHQSVSAAEAAAGEKMLKAGAEPGAAVRPKRLSRPRKAAAVGKTAAAAAAGRGLSSSSTLAPASRSLEEQQGGDQAADDAAEMGSRLTTMQDRFGDQLRFLVTEFTKLEAQLSLECTVRYIDSRSTTRCVGSCHRAGVLCPLRTRCFLQRILSPIKSERIMKG